LAAELAFAPLALISRLRPWLWALMLGMHFTLMLLIDFADLSLGMVMVHFFTFDPAWVKRKTTTEAERVFYDGHCGLCHRAVRFILAEDVRGEAFRFAPLQGEAFKAAVSADEQAKLPDSLVVRTNDGRLLTRTGGVLHIMEQLGGGWRILAGIARLIPGTVLDRLYDAVARIRHRLFQQPSEACPLVRPELRKRFDR
jgi:predicted DCC family thiol-disulfide oxidoreductase YuxK